MGAFNMAGNQSIHGFRILLESLSTTMAEEYGEETVLSMLVATASAVGRSGNLPVELVNNIYRQQVDTYEESAISKCGGFPNDALVIGRRSVN